MSQPNPTIYRIERIESEAQFAALRGPWATLQAAAAPRPAIFLTWEWVTTWCRHLEPGWEPWVLAAWDREGLLAGVAPWMLVHHHYGPFRIDRLAFMGSNYAYRTHQDLVVRPGEETAVTAAFLDYLRGQQASWDVLDLEGLAEASPLKESISRSGGRYVEKPAIDCPYAPLPDSWQAYEMRRLSANRRQQIRARRRHLERDFPGQVAFKTVKDPAELPAAMDALVDLHRKRWHGRGQASSFDQPSFLAFHRDVAQVALECGWLRFYLLQVGERVVAAEYCFLFNGVLFDYQKGMDPDPALDRYSPGQLVLAYALQEAIKEGAREFDMARGTYDYKSSWTDQSRPDYHMIMSASVPGHLWLWGAGLVAQAKLKSHEMLSDSTRQRINQLLSGKRRVSVPPAAGDMTS